MCARTPRIGIVGYLDARRERLPNDSNSSSKHVLRVSGELDKPSFTSHTAACCGAVVRYGICLLYTLPS